MDEMQTSLSRSLGLNAEYPKSTLIDPIFEIVLFWRENFSKNL